MRTTPPRPQLPTRSGPPPRSSRRAVGLVLLLALVLGACSRPAGQDAGQDDGGPAGAAARSGQRGAFGTVLDQIGQDGTVGPDTALQAFSLAVAPLPGVSVPPGPPGEIASASGAIRWLRRHYDTLTPAQQAAAATTLLGKDLPGATGGGLGSGAAQRPTAGEPTREQVCKTWQAKPKDPRAAQYEALAQQAAAQIQQKLGVRLTVPVKVFVHPLKSRGGTYWLDEGCNDQGKLSGCIILVNPDVDGMPRETKTTVMAHEIMHCLQGQLLGLPKALDAKPWVIEGTATWVGETLAGGSDLGATFWTDYLTKPAKSMFSRAYDALGYYAHMAETGLDPWGRIVAIVKAGTSNEDAWDAAVGTSEAFLDSWPSGLARLGAAPWDTTGPAITALKAQPQDRGKVTTGGTASASSKPATGFLGQVDLVAPVVLVGADGPGRLRSADGQDLPFAKLAGTPLCTAPGGCACPDGSAGQGATFHKIAAGIALFGLSGGRKAAKASFAGTSVDAYCKKPPKVQPCLVGEWVSTSATLRGEGVSLDVGPGAAFVIDADGRFGIDLDPVAGGDVTVDGGIHLAEFKYWGAARGSFTTPKPGVYETAGTKGDISADVTVLYPVRLQVLRRGQSLAGLGGLGGGAAGGAKGGIGAGASIASGTYRCSDSRLTIGYEISGVRVRWSFARA